MKLESCGPGRPQRAAGFQVPTLIDSPGRGSRTGGRGTVRPVREVLAARLWATLAEILRPGGVRAGALSPAPAALDHYGWQQRCRGLFELPVAA